MASHRIVEMVFQLGCLQRSPNVEAVLCFDDFNLRDKARSSAEFC